LTQTDPGASPPLLVQDGSIDADDGVTLRPGRDAPLGLTLRAQVAGATIERLHVVAGFGAAAAGVSPGQGFTRSPSGSCS
jgi:hypothetical protein